MEIIWGQGKERKMNEKKMRLMKDGKVSIATLLHYSMMSQMLLNYGVILQVLIVFVPFFACWS
eukprot:UN26251